MILIKEVRLHEPIVARQVPSMARYYRFAFQTPASRKAELFFYVPLRKLFPVCRTLGLLPRMGTFDYERLGQTATIQFDAANTQYQAIYGSLYDSGYEQEVGLLIDNLLPEGGTFYDVGSNWGYFSLHAASRHARLAIHAFEPFPASLRDLQSCVAQAGLTNLVSCHALALSNADGEAFIHVPDGLLSGTARLTGDAGATRITTRRLDGLKLPPPDFIKMDVEGHEAQVLQGSLETLKSSWPFLVFENIRDYSSPAKTLEPLLTLAKLGYRLYIPAVKTKHAEVDYFLPCGWQIDVGRLQPIRDRDWLALSPFEPSARYLFQNDFNVFACHETRHSQLLSVFKEWHPSGPATTPS